MDASGDLQPLRLHWWKAEPNFGDAINPLIVAHVSGRPVVHSGPHQADMFAIGSMMQVVKRTHKEPRETGEKLNVWGTGLLNPVFAHSFLDNIEIALLRGPVTAALLKLEMKDFGDPGLLINEALPFNGERSDRIGIVPHHSQADDPEFVALVAADPAFMLIDPRGAPAEVCHQIAGCAQIFAGSLHGLVVADAYGIANRWIDPGGQSWLKYLDYAASIGRTDMIAPLDIDDIQGHRHQTIVYQNGIEAAREALHASFPEHLKSGATRQPQTA